MSKELGREEKLFKGFPSVSKNEWKDQVVKDLKGKEFEKLIWKGYENLSIDPFYAKEDLESINYLLNSDLRSNDWTINQEISAGEVTNANALAQNAVLGGANGITFVIREDESAQNISTLLNGIDLESVHIHFQSGGDSLKAITTLIDEAKNRDFDLNKIQGSIDFDPLGDLLLQGKSLKQQTDILSELSKTAPNLADHLPKFKALKIHSSHFQNSGASITQELAFTLCAAVEYIDQLSELGMDIDRICELSTFSFSVGSNYFMEIAKLRAARLLWAQIIEQYPVKNELSKLMHIEVSNSSWNKTMYDPYVNLLRGTVEAMAASLGGAHSITIKPFDSELDQADDFSLRMARNTQLILKNESYLERVSDPSAGSYYIEKLTDSIAKESLRLFKEIESAGGFLESIKSGAIQDAIEETKKQKDMNIALRKDTILGVNQYPNLQETILDKIKLDSSSSDTLAASGDIKTLTPYRGAQAFEEMRILTERHFESTAKKPKVFLLTIGNPSMRTARASFSANFFGCAGFEIINNIGFESAENGVDAAIENDSDLVVICSSDKEYPEFAPQICQQIKDRKPEMIVIVAGNPKEHIDQLKEVGVQDFIHVRSNALETLSKYQKLLGIRD